MASAKLQLVKPTDAQNLREATLDEFGAKFEEVERKEAELAPTKARLKLLREIIVGMVPADLPADQDKSFSGKSYIVNASMCRNVNGVQDKKKLYKVMGAEKFFELCEIGVGALQESLGKVAAALWLSKTRTGARSITAVAKPQKSEAA